MSKLLIFIIKIYQQILSPMLPYKCRFYPSCSNYAIEALRNFKLYKALWLTFLRVLRCNPYNKNWGYDPIPDTNNQGNKKAFI